MSACLPRFTETCHRLCETLLQRFLAKLDSEDVYAPYPGLDRLPLLQAAEKQVSQLRKDRDAAQSRAEKAERGLESLGYDKGQEDGLAGDREKEEKTVEGLREVWKH